MNARRWAPTAVQALLLQAVHRPADEAAAAWLTWQKRYDLYRDHLDPLSFVLLPNVARNLSDRLDGLPHGGRLRGIARQAWVKSQLQERARQAAVEQLSSIGIPTRVTSLTYAADPACPNEAPQKLMIIPPAAAQAALHHLLQGKNRRPRAAGQPAAAQIISLPNHPQSLVISWRPIYPLVHSALDALIFKSMTQTADLPAEFDLLLILLNGFIWRPQPYICWSIDARRLIEEKEVNWNRFAHHMIHLGLTFPVNHMLRALAQLWRRAWPSDLTDPLESTAPRPSFWPILGRPRSLLLSRVSYPVLARLLSFMTRRLTQSPSPSSQKSGVGL